MQVLPGWLQPTAHAPAALWGSPTFTIAWQRGTQWRHPGSWSDCQLLVCVLQDRSGSFTKTPKDGPISGVVYDAGGLLTWPPRQQTCWLPSTAAARLLRPWCCCPRRCCAVF